MTSANETVNQLHSEYIRLRGFNPAKFPLSYHHERGWLAFINEGLTVDDLRHGIRHRERRILQGVRQPESLALRNITGSEERLAEFREDACAEEAIIRSNKDRAKNKVLELTGRAPEEKPVRTSGEVIQKLASEMHKAAS